MATSPILCLEDLKGKHLSVEVLRKENSEAALEIIQHLRSYFLQVGPNNNPTIFGAFSRKAQQHSLRLNPTHYNIDWVKYFLARIEFTGRSDAVGEVMDLQDRMEAHKIHIIRRICDKKSICFEYDLFQTDACVIGLILKRSMGSQYWQSSNLYAKADALFK